MNWKKRDKIIEAIYKNEPLFIKDTGVKVSVDYFGTDTDKFGSFGKKPTAVDKCQISFETAPTMKALKACTSYHIKKNSHTKKIELDAQIEIDKLSILPYESKAAKILYKQKTNSKE